MEDFDDDRTIRGKRVHDGVCLSDDELTMKDLRSRIRDGEFKSGDRIVRGRYEIREVLGQGGMGIVYRCYDTVTRLDVALKTLPPEISRSRDEMEEIRSNFAIAGKLNHPNIVAMRTLEEADGRIFLVMDYVEGVGLKGWVRSHSTDGTLNFSDFIHIMKQVASALDYAHSQGVLHRDIKPQNIMVTADNTAKLLDFGLAAQIKTSMAHVSMTVQDTSGTMPYMAPEQWRGKGQRPATDQYALAVIVYEMFSGNPPFENLDKDIMCRCVLNETPDKIDGVSECVNGALQKALSKEPRERFESCVDFINALVDKKAQSQKSVLVTSETSQNELSSQSQISSPDDNLKVYILSDEIEQLKSKIEALNPSGGQTFEAHLKSFFSDRQDGVKAMKNADYPTATSLFRHAAEEAKWILDNIPLRQRAADLLERNKRNFEFVSPYVKGDNADFLARAKAGLEYGRDLYNQGDFLGTAKCLESAFADILPFIRENLLLQCEEAVEKKNFGRLNFLANQLRPYDAENSDRYFAMVKEKESKETKVEKILISILVFILIVPFFCLLFAVTQENETREDKPVAQQAETEIAQINDLLVNGKIAEFIEDGMVKMEPGTFTMARRDEMNFHDETEHQVTLTKCYWIAKTEVTQKQWNSIMETNPSSVLGDNYPVNNVSWEDAQAFLKELNKKYGYLLPSGYVFDLPTEAQWEYAAQHGVKLQNNAMYHEGDRLDMVGWYRDNSKNKMHLVGQKEPNELGLYDMLGNVSEWCRDWYDKIDSKAVTDPAGPSKSTYHVRRGGNYCSDKGFCRSSYRDCGLPKMREQTDGFRLAVVSMIIGNRLDNVSDETKKVELPGNIQLEMIKVEPGTFTMAHHAGEDYLINEKLHEVTLTKGYWLGKTEVTQEQWKVVMGDNPSKFKNDDNCPVEQVSWDDIQKFLKKLNDMYAGKLPAGYKFDLPTEAQWEYAAQGGHKRSGYTKYAGSNELDEVGWFSDNSGHKTHPVGQKSPNELGLYDMSGNVKEWCRDWHGDYNGDVTDPHGPLLGTKRVSRGGCWLIIAWFCRGAYRGYSDPSSRNDDCGFRLALVPIQ